MVFISNSCNIFSQFDFQPIVYTDVTYPEVVSTGDVNNDGLNDVVVGSGVMGNATDYKIHVFLQDASGNLLAPISYAYPQTNPGIKCMAIRDLNNDQLNDVVIAYGEYVGIFFQSNTGTLNIGVTYHASFKGDIDGLSTGDLDSNGLMDIAVSHTGGNEISVLYQSVAGNFINIPYPTDCGVNNQIEITDINNDQKDDLILMVGKGSEYHLILQNKFGNLDGEVVYNSNTGLEAMGIGDMNNDNRNDIAELIKDGTSTSVRLLYQNNSNSFFSAPFNIPLHDEADIVKIDNLNCDSQKEIIIAHGGVNSSSLSIETLDPNLYFTISVPIVANINHHGISIGDINNDGRKDIVCVSGHRGFVAIINKSTDIKKPQKPTGKSLICITDSVYNYKAGGLNDGIVTWQIYPNISGTIMSYTKDSCKILWNNAWRGKASVTVTVKNNCGTNVSDILGVNLISLKSLNLGKDTILCKNSTLKLNAGKGFSTYKWEGLSGDSTFTVTRGGVYHVEVTNACGTGYDTIRITEVQLPLVNITDTVICPGSNIQIDATLSGNNLYKWQDNSTNPIYNVANSGIYSVTITDTNKCVNSKTIKVENITLPEFYFPTDTTVCNTINFSLNAAFPQSTYLWDDGSTLSHHKIEQSGVYSVAVTNSCGTVNKNSSVTIDNCLCYLDVPSAFSPNSDGWNDILYAVGTNITDVNFTIYNRWGQKVFESKSLDKGWDGMFQGKKVDPAVFIYYVTAKSSIDGHLLQKQGNITLIR